MPSTFHDRAFVQDQYPVRIADGAQAVRGHHLAQGKRI